MLKIIDTAAHLPYSQIMDIYEYSNREKGKCNYPQLEESEQLLLAEQDFYAYLQDVLDRQLAIFSCWSVGGRAVAALRLEKYRDGFLLAGLETAPAERRRGYASALVQAIVNHFPNCRIYSHIFNGNHASVMLHKKCGFKRIEDIAVLLDGSISTEVCTYLYD